MTMDTLQIRLNSELIKGLDIFVKSGFYANRAEAIRDAIRRFIWESQIDSIKNKSPSIPSVKKIRKELSSQNLNIEKINSL